MDFSFAGAFVYFARAQHQEYIILIRYVQCINGVFQWFCVQFGGAREILTIKYANQIYIVVIWKWFIFICIYLYSWMCTLNIIITKTVSTWIIIIIIIILYYDDGLHVTNTVYVLPQRATRTTRLSLICVGIRALRCFFNWFES